ncbi:MAG TPA: GNAT family N-acetyltransferase [Thermomicrobiales bacterium]|nr:GNAT family N-acetyltransferase [Thermomicrobiales bacterium]
MLGGEPALRRGALVRIGERVVLRRHVAENRSAFQRWYADAEIARLLRHDLEPLTAAQSRSYFDSLILPLSARGMCWAIHEANGDRLVGSSALTDVIRTTGSALFRILIGERACWGQGYGTEATRLVVAEAFSTLDLKQVRLEVFRHNERALASYRRVGFREVGEHTEFVPRRNIRISVVEMALERGDFNWDEGGRAADIE